MSERDAKDKLSHKQVAYEHPAKGEDHCKDCKHFRIAERYSNTRSIKYEVFECAGAYDLVTGELLPAATARAERGLHGVCGIEGRLFTPKSSKP